MTNAPDDSPMNDPAVRRVIALSEAASGMLRVARALAGSQRGIDLDGLQAELGLLCARSLDLPAEQGRAMGPRLAALVTDLDALRDALQAP